MQIQARNITPLEMKREKIFLTNIFPYLFYTQFLLVIILELYLIIHGVLTASHTTHFDPKQWYLPLLPSTACAGIVAFSWQILTSCSPSRMFKATFCLSPLLTCAYGVLLVSIDTPGSKAASVFTLSSSIFQSLYACWARPRFQHALRILTVSITHNPPQLKTILPPWILISTLYSALLISGIGEATAIGEKFKTIFIFLTIGSLTWTLHIARNTIIVTISHIKYMRFANGIEIDIKTVVRYSTGSICVGSILVPVLGVIRGVARAISVVSGDVDEFMFSCANCCSRVAERLVRYGNRWGFVQVGVYNKGIVEASMDTWEMFTRIEMEKVIDTDLTSSFCFLCGTVVGSTCALIGGSWAFVIHKTYATEVSLYAFLTGYLVSRVGMAWIQASVAAYYVAYAENPRSEQFDSTIPDYIQALQRLQG